MELTGVMKQQLDFAMEVAVERFDGRLRPRIEGLYGGCPAIIRVASPVVHDQRQIDRRDLD
ncbi:hypothetical protein CH282_16150 [Rhodococcus sp. 06-418-1B]|nr:hypothetical protein CH282_16150 [Rhodococcus sp. 06-418-1B]